MPWPSVCLSVCLSQVGVLSKRLNGSSIYSFWHRGYPPLILHCVCLNIRVLPSGIVTSSELSRFFCFLPQHVDRHKRCQLSSTDGLSSWASTFVYDTMGVTQRVARVRLRQPRLMSARNDLGRSIRGWTVWRFFRRRIYVDDGKFCFSINPQNDKEQHN